MDAVDAVIEERCFLGAGERGNPATTLRPGQAPSRARSWRRHIAASR